MKNPFGFTIRKCKKSDYEFCYGLIEKGLFPYFEKYGGLDKSKFKNNFNSKYSRMKIIEKGKRRIGFYEISKDENCKHCLYIDKMFISPSYQKKGIGKFLMNYFETLDSKKIRLTVLENNPAKVFYTKLGYKLISKKNHRLLKEKKI